MRPGYNTSLPPPPQDETRLQHLPPSLPPPWTWSQHPPPLPPGLCTGGRYASYWNAFLFKRKYLMRVAAEPEESFNETNRVLNTSTILMRCQNIRVCFVKDDIKLVSCVCQTRLNIHDYSCLVVLSGGS